MKNFLFFIVGLTLFINTRASPPLQLQPLQGVDPSNDGNFKESEVAAEGVRLPKTVIPIHYDLEIRPILDLPATDPQQFTAPGKVSIRVKCINSTNAITLHSDDIIIQHSSVTVTSVTSGTSVLVTGYTNDSTVSMYTVNLGSNLTANEEYILAIPFTALVGDRLSGLYRSSYFNSTGVQKWLATTQFQKLGARQAFPCMDEPAMKATFNITIGRSNSFHSLSNSPLIGTTPIPGLPGWVWDSYGTTVKMSSYLVAMIVSDFQSVEAPTELSKYTVKTWGPPNLITPATGDFSSKAAARILTFLENYYNYTYQFPKLDSVAIPDFAAGAMENWAINTYRMNLMLWYEGDSTQFEQWRQSAVIAHEIVHHWFGDLVTCDWWNDLWLNEGFARYMQFLGANSTGSVFGAIDRYTIDVIQLAMDFDVTSASEPVHSNVTDQVVNVGSRIAYEKAAALIRMMQSFLTEETLIVGLKNYLKKHQYSSTVQDDLFAELQAQAEADGTAAELFSVKQIMDTWTMKTGFPLIRVSRAAPGNGVVYLSQERFILPGSVHDDIDFWYVPISYATQADPDFSSSNWQPKLWLDKDTVATSMTINSTDDWLIVNSDARNYYRVIYDEHFFSLIQNQLTQNHTVFSLSSRSQLIDDYFKSAFAEYINIQTALNLTIYLGNENENTVWTSALNNLRQSYNLLRDTNASEPFKNYMLKLVEQPLIRIGWDQKPTDSPVTIILRSQLLDWACSVGSPNCTSMAKTLADNWLADPVNNRIPADIQPVVFCTATSTGDSTNNEKIRQQLLIAYKQLINGTRDDRQLIFINALACETNELTISSLLLNETISDTSEVVKSKHGITLMQRVSENTVGRKVVLEFLSSKTDDIITSLGESAISSVISSISAYTTDETVATTVNTFIDSYLTRPNVSDSVRQSLEASKVKLTTNSEWISKYYQSMKEWFEKQLSP